VRQPPQPWFHRSMWWGTWPANAKGMLWWAGSVLAMLLALMFGGVWAAVVVLLVSNGVAVLKSEVPPSADVRKRRDALRARMWRR
jgi:hypothetical protein